MMTMMALYVALSVLLISSSAFIPSRRLGHRIIPAQTFMISSGFSFGDGEQVLVSVQKPLGVILEQQEEEDGSSIIVVEVASDSSAGRAGIQLGDVLIAVQNADMTGQPIETVLGFIGQAPKVINLRFRRPPSSSA